MIIAEYLSNYAHSLKYKDLPEEVVHEVKRRIIDSLGCGLGAYDSGPSIIVRKIAGQVQSKKGATILGTSEKTSPDLAAFANSTMIRYLDYNDTYLSKEPAHPSDDIGAALAVAEEVGASGTELITAIALGYEVHCRLCDAAGLRSKGWDHVTYGPITSSLIAARLMGLSEERVLHALSIAIVSNIAMRQTRVGEISMWKACAFANAAKNGVFASTLASLGMTGPSQIFEGEKGFFKQVSGPFSLEPFGGRGGNFKILDTYVKAFPAEYHAQSAIEAALDLRCKIKDINEIQSIDVKTFDAALEIIAGDREKWNPKTRETADHSLPYCVAVALMDGGVGLRQFTEERITEPRLHQLIQKIRVVSDKDFTQQYPEAMPNEIEITTKGGSRYIEKVLYPKGHPKNPMSDEDIEGKFRELAGRFLSPFNMDRLLDRLWHLEEMKEITEIVTLWDIGDEKR